MSRAKKNARTGSSRRPRAQPAARAKSVTTAPKKRTASAPRKPQSLLILHLDAEKLHHDGLHLGDVAAVSGTLSSLVLGAAVAIENTTTVDDLHQRLAKHAIEKRHFDVVVVVGHSNAAGIRIGSDAFVPWNAFAEYLKPFKPRRLLLVACCKAGRWDAGEVLFGSLAQLRRIFACPVNASKDFGALMLFAVPYVVAERRPSDKHITWSQVASIAVTGRQLREWRRTTDKGNPESAMFDLIADLADPFAREVPTALRSAVNAVLRP